MLWKNQCFTIAHADSGTFQGAGLRPFGIKHRELRHSDDMERIEITLPADFTMQKEGAE